MKAPLSFPRIVYPFISQFRNIKNNYIEKYILKKHVAIQDLIPVRILILINSITDIDSPQLA